MLGGGERGGGGGAGGRGTSFAGGKKYLKNANLLRKRKSYSPFPMSLSNDKSCAEITLSRNPSKINVFIATSFSSSFCAETGRL